VVNVCTKCFSNYVVRWEYCIVISFFLQLHTWFLYLIWIGIFSVFYCLFYVDLFFSVMVQFSLLLDPFAV
jgi:hypothetical protein